MQGLGSGVHKQRANIVPGHTDSDRQDCALVGVLQAAHHTWYGTSETRDTCLSGSFGTTDMTRRRAVSPASMKYEPGIQGS